jgi:hypothetical protein
MTPAEYEQRLAQYHKAFIRQCEILSSYHERQRSLASEVAALKEQFDSLQKALIVLQKTSDSAKF